MTVQDINTGKIFYEIYVRREVENDSTTGLKGLNSFCLASREEVPDLTHNLIQFADLDRDGMVDMFYANVQADSKGLGVTIHYNGLLNAERQNG